MSVMFSTKYYDFDRNNEIAEAKLLEEAVLYRLTSLTHNTPECILNGRGPVATRKRGRFHGPDQLTTYCTNNVLTGICEMLFHMYRALLDQIGSEGDYRLIRREMYTTKCLVVFRVRAIDGLVHLDSEGVERDYQTKVAGTLAVWPDATYGLFDRLNCDFRNHRLNGVMYPSARHSLDKCFALFGDLSEKLLVTDPSQFHRIQIRLQLVPEDHPMHQPPREFSPFKFKVHPSRGYYQVLDVPAFSALVSLGWINPNPMPLAGTVSFLRQPYRSYPSEAVTAVPAP
jgi:hypothetical protein